MLAEIRGEQAVGNNGFGKVEPPSIRQMLLEVGCEPNRSAKSSIQTNEQSAATAGNGRSSISDVLAAARHQDAGEPAASASTPQQNEQKPAGESTQQLSADELEELQALPVETMLTAFRDDATYKNSVRDRVRRNSRRFRFITPSALWHHLLGR
ncbi:hypothetical protein [Stratiformator vulcanicus]|nr:hypothetical protein [Stratiformator vulcanicus]